LSFLIPGIVMMSLMNNAFQNCSSSIIISKFHGDLQDLKSVPLSPNQVVLAYSIGGLTRGLMVGLSVLTVGELFYLFEFNQFLAISHPIVLLFFSVIGAMIFAQFGMSIAFWANNFDKVNGVGTFILLPLIYLGGVFFSLEVLHPTWQFLSKFNPVLYLINGFRYGLVGQADVDPVSCAIFSLLALGVTHLLAQHFVRHGSFTRF